LIERGFNPGPEIGRVLKAAYEAQLEGRFADLSGALKWLEIEAPAVLGRPADSALPPEDI
jgi:hypothetical protein